VSGGYQDVEVMLWDTEAGPGGPGEMTLDLGGVYRCNFLPSSKLRWLCTPSYILLIWTFLSYILYGDFSEGLKAPTRQLCWIWFSLELVFFSAAEEQDSG